MLIHLHLSLTIFLLGEQCNSFLGKLSVALNVATNSDGGMIHIPQYLPFWVEMVPNLGIYLFGNGVLEFRIVLCIASRISSSTQFGLVHN